MIALLDHRDDIIRLVNKINANFREAMASITKADSAISDLGSKISSLESRVAELEEAAQN